jgi:hypothetical protein
VIVVGNCLNEEKMAGRYGVLVVAEEFVQE